MTFTFYHEKDADSIYEELTSIDSEDFEDDGRDRDNDRMDDMISRYGF
jgi:hypothetical protein